MPFSSIRVELVINRVEAKAKLSQNRPGADIDGVIRVFRRAQRPRWADVVRAARP